MDAHLPPKKTTKSKRNLITEILQKKKVKKEGLRVTLTTLKKNYYLKSIEQAACFYIDKYKLDINVSDIIDDVTRQAIQNVRTRTTTPAVKQSPSKAKTRNINVPKLNWMPSSYYSKAAQLSDFYSYIFIFENALRYKINEIMSSKDPKWWETKLKIDLPKVYKYSIEEKARQDVLPIVGTSGILQPIDYLTLGRLESIITKYKGEFIPSVFHTPDFFTSHMDIIKRVRNGLAHMAPSISGQDISNAKHEIDILLQNLSTK
jgi:hypothetical protein